MKQFFKYVLATLCGLVLYGILSGILMFVWMISVVLSLSSSTDSVQLKEHSVYRICLKGELVERNEQDEMLVAVSQLFDTELPNVLSLQDVIDNINYAKDNPNIDGIYLDGGSLSAGFASREALRRALVDFKESGKFIFAYADTYTQGNYWLASVADSVCLNSDGVLVWNGLSANVMFYSRMLEKIGVEMQVLKVGTFKSAVEPYILTEMSEANRLQMQTLVEDMWKVVKEDVSLSRNISIENLDSLADINMTYQAPSFLVECGLVDELIYSQDVKTLLTEMTGTEDYHFVSHSSLLSLRQEDKTKSDKIAVLYAQGDIVDEGDEGIVGKKMVKTIDKLTKDDDVKAVVLRVNSPGGSAYASEQIWHALQLLIDKKPVVVSMGDYAASGGYYISCGADSIFAEETTLTGSIGIFGIIPSVAELTDKIGIDFDGVGTNRFSLSESDMVFKGMSEEERGLMQAMINRGYELFVSRCADGRAKTTDQIKEIAEGRVWSGIRAKEIGLVDELGGLDRAIASAAVMANVEDYRVVVANEDKKSFFELLLDTTTSEEEKAVVNFYKNIKQAVKQPTLQARLPYNVEIK